MKCVETANFIAIEINIRFDKLVDEYKCILSWARALV